MNSSDNGDGMFTCEINVNEQVCGYTADTAPVVMPINTPGYSAMSTPEGYSSSAAQYTSTGVVYLNVGCRGRDHGAPAGVTDLKAAVSYNCYINNLGLKDGIGNVLILSETENGIYQAGSYYDYVAEAVEQSLDNFLNVYGR